MRNQIKTDYFKTPFGELLLGSFEDKLCLCDWRYRKMRDAIDKKLKVSLDADYFDEVSEVVNNTKIQLSQYFKGERKLFEIPLLLIGTEFQKSVWNALQEIPYGKTISYLELSKNLKIEKAIRAIASANGANAISILIPCHRVIGSDGNLVGYAGGLNAKMNLLSLENSLNKSQLTLF